MVFRLALSVIVLLIPGTLLVQSLWPSKDSLHSSLLLKILLGVSLGFGVSSIFTFLWSIAFGSISVVYAIAETSLSVCIVVAFVYRRRKDREPLLGGRQGGSIFDTRLSRLSAGALFISATCILTTALVTIAREPHGQGDATAIWNLIARFIFRDGSGWTDALSNHLGWTHSDYPLFLPLSVARMWVYAGETQLAPALIALIFTFGTLGLIVSSVSLLRTPTQGCLAGLVLLEPFLFFRIGTYEYADTPLGFFLLAALVLFCLKDRTAGGNRLVIMAGLMMGFAAWTKNEGLILLFAIVASRFVAVTASQGLRTYLKEMLYFSIGAVPILLVLLYFKATIAPPNDLVAGQSLRATAERLLDLSRYVLILKAFLSQFIGFRNWYAHPSYLLIIYAWLLGVKAERAERATLLTLVTTVCLALAGYLFIYVTTPRDLGWHLTFSLDRLLIHLWPSFVLSYFFFVLSPEKALTVPKRTNSEYNIGSNQP